MHFRSLGIAIAMTALAGSAMAAMAVASPSPLIVSGNGISQLHLGASESSASAVLDRLLGQPTAKIVTVPAMMNCGVDALGSWHALGAYFNHHRLVGFEFGPGDVPAVRTAAGLKLGDPLSRARLIYAHKLTTSGVNGGAWFAATATGRIDGFLTWNGAYGPSPTSKIFTIDVGDVGCPAMSP
jgi:hypothetical protein